MATRVLMLALLFVSIHIGFVRGADPDPVLDNPANVTSFVLRNSFTNANITIGSGGVRAGLNTKIFPAIIGQGLVNVQTKLKPCGINTPHIHPRASELLTLISGGPLQAGFVDTFGNTFIYILNPGDIIVFPRGLLHFEFNVGTEEAYFLSALNSQNPGTLTAADALLKLPNRALASAFNQDLKTTEKLKAEGYHYGILLQLDERSGCVPGADITSINF